MDSTMTGTENAIWVRIINQIPEPTKLKPLDPHSNNTERPREDVGTIKGILRMDRMKLPYQRRTMMKDNGIAIHVDT